MDFNYLNDAYSLHLPTMHIVLAKKNMYEAEFFLKIKSKKKKKKVKKSIKRKTF